MSDASEGEVQLLRGPIILEWSFISLQVIARESSSQVVKVLREHSRSFRVEPNDGSGDALIGDEDVDFGGAHAYWSRGSKCRRIAVHYSMYSG